MTHPTTTPDDQDVHGHGATLINVNETIETDDVQGHLALNVNEAAESDSPKNSPGPSSRQWIHRVLVTAGFVIGAVVAAAGPAAAGGNNWTG